MASSASAQTVLVAVQNGSTIVYGGATYPIVANKVTIASRVYWVRTGGILIWCDTCTPASSGTGTTGGTTTCPTAPPADRSYVSVSGTNVIYGGCTYPMAGSNVTILGNTYLVGPGGVVILRSTPSTGGTTGGTTGGSTTCPTTPPADRAYVTVSGSSVIYGACTYPMAGSNVTILGNTYLVGPGGVLIRISASGGTTQTTCPTTPPADRSTVTVNGTNVIYGACTYPMSGSNVTILGTTYVVGPGGLLILYVPSPATCPPTTPPANGAAISVSGTNVVYSGCSFAMSGPINVTILGKTYLVVSNRYLILTTPPSTGGTTPPSTGGTPPPSTGGTTGGPEPSAGTWGTPVHVMSSPGGYIYKYDVAYDQQTRQFLVVLRSSYAGYDPAWGQFLDAAGAKIGSSFIISVGKTAFDPRVAASGDGTFLVSYGSGGDRIVQTVRYEGGPKVGSPIVIDSSASPWMSSLAWAPQNQWFVVMWGKNGSTSPFAREVWARPVTSAGTLLAARRIAWPKTGEVSPLATPEIAVGSDGNALVVGYRDCTDSAWLGKCGIYVTLIDPNGISLSSTENIIYPNYSRFPKVVFNSASRTYQVMWITYTGTGGQVLGKRFNLDGSPIDAAPYTVKATNRTNAYFGDDTFGELGLAYEPVSDTYLLAFRGQDPGNGTAPLWRMVADSEGQGANSSIWEVSDATKSPEPVIISDDNGKATVFYRGGWSDIFLVKVTR